MENVLGYHVFTTRDGGMWLSDDEKTWTSRFLEAAEFTDAKLANDIGEREATPEDTIYVFACMGSM